MKNVICAAFAVLTIGATSAYAKPFVEMFPGVADDLHPDALAVLEKLDYQQGRISVDYGYAEVDVGEDFYFLSPKDARIVLEDLWGNPPDEQTVGLLFPSQYTPLDGDSWGVEFAYEDIGYVKDDDAASYDYDDLLKQMQADIRAGAEWRRENGYSNYNLLGWAAEPHYDAETHKLFWAQELKFEGTEDNTLNYYIRVLGRKGVLNLNFIADMSSLQEVEGKVPTVLGMVNFTQGNRYEDFDAATDKVADVSIGNLIGGESFTQAGIAVAALVLLKKFWFVLLLPLIWLKNLFTGRRNS